uniref:Uncharacterized protein n=1 Tax=Anguilla anguilla TaxID=7936 RepID=A0A0E9RLH3_ANGAN
MDMNQITTPILSNMFQVNGLHL